MENSIADIFETLYLGVPEQTCAYCGTVGKYRGWMSLCNRSCYHRLTELLDAYEGSTDLSVKPDDRLVQYFTKYPEPHHAFIFDKLQVYLSRLR